MRGEIFDAVGPALHGPALLGAGTYTYEKPDPVSVGNAALMLAASAKAAYRQIIPERTGGQQPWMRAPPGAHVLAWAFNEFKKLYGSLEVGEVAMRHSLASYMHSSEIMWWPLNSMKAWMSRGHTKLLEITDHGNMRTRGPATPLEARCAQPLAPFCDHTEIACWKPCLD